MHQALKDDDQLGLQRQSLPILGDEFDLAEAEIAPDSPESASERLPEAERAAAATR